MRVYMIGAFFNPYQYFRDTTQNIFDFRKIFDFSKLTPEFDSAKVWDFSKQNINSASSINKSLTDDMTAIAEKQTSIAKENTECLTTAMKETAQSHMTPQKMLEIQGQFYQENAARNARYAKELAEMYTTTTKRFFEAWSQQAKQYGEKNSHMGNPYGETSSEWYAPPSPKKKKS